jgi:hypothetical protein
MRLFVVSRYPREISRLMPSPVTIVAAHPPRCTDFPQRQHPSVWMIAERLGVGRLGLFGSNLASWRTRGFRGSRRLCPGTPRRERNASASSSSSSVPITRRGQPDSGGHSTPRISSWDLVHPPRSDIPRSRNSCVMIIRLAASRDQFQGTKSSPYPSFLQRRFESGLHGLY